MPEPINKKDLAFIEKRRKLVRSFNLVGLGMFASLTGLTAWLFWAHPRLVNPLHVVAELEAGSISPSTVEFMAVLMPIIVLALLVMTGVVIVFAFAMIANERRYLKVIDELQRDSCLGSNDINTP